MNPEKKPKSIKIKPDYSVVASKEWWEDRQKGMDYLAQSKPVTVQEALEQLSQHRNSKNYSQGKKPELQSNGGDN